MTVQTDLSIAIDAYIQTEFTGSLAEIGATKLPLQTLLEIQQSLSTGGGGGGGGDASAANQATQITEAELTNTRIGEVSATPSANTVLARLKAIADALVFGIKTAANSLSVVPASDAVFVGSNAQTSFTETQLTAIGTTTSRSMSGYSKAFITVLVASINTNVVVRIEGSNDGTNWTNLSVLNVDTTISANGVVGFVFEGCPAFIRTNFVSEAGGTAATVDVITRLSA